MRSPSPPKPPDPKETASAQTSTNVQTAIANAALGQVNQYTPYGSLEYTKRIGDDGQPMFQTVTDSDGKTHQVPMYDQTVTLSPEQQALLDTGQATQQELAQIALDQSGRIGSLLGTEVDVSNLPAGGSAAGLTPTNFVQPDNLDTNFQTQVTPYNLEGQFSVPGNVQQSLGPRGQITGDVGSIPGLNTNFRTSGSRSAGNIQRSVKDVGQQTEFDDAGDVQRGVDRQTAQRDFGDAGDITRTYGTDFSKDRRRVEDALFSRLNPQLDRDREALRTSLINQGVREGSQAFDRAMSRFNEQSNDARMQTILAGGQEQSRLANLEAQRAGFANAAQMQAYQQAMGRGQFANQAAQQQLGMDIAAGQFGNQAQQQAFNQAMERGDFANRARQAQFGQNLAAGQFANAAQAQAAQQGIQNSQLAIQAQRAANEAAQAQFGMQLGAAQFANTAQQQAFNQDLTAGQFANQAQQQAFNQDVTGADFANRAQQQAFNQDLTSGQFGNQAQQQAFNQALAGAQFGNQAAQNQFGMDMQSANFGNTALAAQNDARMAAAQAQNQAQMNQFNTELAAQQYADTNRQNALGEVFGLRNQPINEISALMGGAQVTQPNFGSANAPQVPGVDFAGLTMDNYNQRLNAWLQQTAQQQSLMGGILGLGGNLGAAAIMSDRW